jgi:hypothetical protein
MISENKTPKTYDPVVDLPEFRTLTCISNNPLTHNSVDLQQARRAVERLANLHARAKNDRNNDGSPAHIDINAGLSGNRLDVSRRLRRTENHPGKRRLAR